ncbi:MAG: hypothetical protein HFF06_03145 [Oscillospiraceae bacterium]|jgi:hypothetical protein|nr:hypothetical protein [Oscillospiraceae bacterium]
MPRQTRNELIKCEYCGEMYAASYKHCPFCNEDGTGRWDDPDSMEEEYYDDELPVRGGRRLAGGRDRRPGGEGPSVGRIISWVLSLALIIAAAGILFSIARSFLGVGKKDPKPVESQPPVEVQTPNIPMPTLPPVEPTPEPSQPPAPGPDIPAVDLTAPTDFKLKKDDISFFTVGEKYQMPVTVTPADAHAVITWTSSNPAVATVDANGLITAVSRGTVDITASIEGLGERKCIVRCNLQEGGGTTAPTENTSAPANPGSLTLSREDFTLSSVGESWVLKVSGSTSPVTWASSNTSVATVDANGKVTAVSKGVCNVTATVDGVTLKCIVRCTF